MRRLFSLINGSAGHFGPSTSANRFFLIPSLGSDEPLVAQLRNWFTVTVCSTAGDLTSSSSLVADPGSGSMNLACLTQGSCRHQQCEQHCRCDGVRRSQHGRIHACAVSNPPSVVPGRQQGHLSKVNSSRLDASNTGGDRDSDRPQLEHRVASGHSSGAVAGRRWRRGGRSFARTFSPEPYRTCGPVSRNVSTRRQGSSDTRHPAATLNSPPESNP